MNGEVAVEAFLRKCVWDGEKNMPPAWFFELVADQSIGNRQKHICHLREEHHQEKFIMKLVKIHKSRAIDNYELASVTCVFFYCHNYKSSYPKTLLGL